MKRVPVPATADEWRDFCGNLVKANLKLSGMEYKDLEIKLAEIGIHQSANAISLKLSRGTFSAIFLLQTLVAMGVDEINLPLRIEMRHK